MTLPLLRRSAPLWLAACAAGLLPCAALAQSAGGAPAQPARVQAAYAEWRKLPQSEVNCVDKTLRTRNSTLWLAIQRGAHPNDSAMASVRASCRPVPPRTAATPSRAVQNGAQALAAVPETSAETVTAVTATVTESSADKLAAEKAAAQKAAAEKAAAEKAAAEKIAADNAATEKAATEKAAAEKAAADKLAAEKMAAEKLAAEQAVAEKTALKAADHASAAKMATPAAASDSGEAAAGANDIEPALPLPGTELRAEAADYVTAAAAAAEARVSFVYGLISGPIVFSLGGMMVLLFGRSRTRPLSKRNAPARKSDGPAQKVEAGAAEKPATAGGIDIDRLVAAVLAAEQKRRDGAAAAPATAPRTEAAALH